LTEARGSARKPGAKETGAGPALAFHDKAGSHYVAPTKGRRFRNSGHIQLRGFRLCSLSYGG